MGDEDEELPTAAKLDTSWAAATRMDLASGELSTTRRTPQGGLAVRARMTRTGVFDYRQPDGTVRRELRHPDEVFDKDSLDSLAHATITVDHVARVAPDNWRRVAAGHVAGRPKRDGKFVAGDIHIQDGATMGLAESGKLQECSCGYDCLLDPTPGEYEGQKYDAIQRRIRYNHVAIGPAGWGRAGPEVRMRLDGGACVSGSAAGDSYVRGMTEEEKAALKAAQDAATKAAADLVKARSDAADAKTDADKANTAKAVTDAENVTLRAENAVLKLQAKRDDAADTAARTDALVAETIAIRADAQSVFATKDDPKGDKWSHAGKSLAAIKREVIAKLEPEMKLDGLDGAALDAVYGIALSHHKKVRGAQDQLGRALESGAGNRDDAGNPFAGGDDTAPDAAKAKKAMDDRKRDGWKKDRAAKGGK